MAKVVNYIYHIFIENTIKKDWRNFSMKIRNNLSFKKLLVYIICKKTSVIEVFP